MAVDADLNPNLGIFLGLSAAAVEKMQPVLNALLAAGHTHHAPKPDADDLLARFGVAAPYGVTLIATGRIERPTDACLCCGSHMTTREFFGDLSDDGRIVVADLEAGLNDLVWANPAGNDIVIVVSDGSAKAVEGARRASALARDMGVRRVVAAANRCAGPEEPLSLGRALGVEAFVVPEDPTIRRADHLRTAAIDLDEMSPSVVAIETIADFLERLEPAAAR